MGGVEQFSTLNSGDCEADSAHFQSTSKVQFSSAGGDDHSTVGASNRGFLHIFFLQFTIFCILFLPGRRFRVGIQESSFSGSIGSHSTWKSIAGGHQERLAIEHRPFPSVL